MNYKKRNIRQNNEHQRIGRQESGVPGWGLESGVPGGGFLGHYFAPGSLLDGEFGGAHAVPWKARCEDVRCFGADASS